VGILETGLRARRRRASVRADDLANVDTPNYEARDLVFEKMLSGKMEQVGGFNMRTTQSGRIVGAGFALDDSGLMYRIPSQPSIDGNTVEDQIEHAEYMKNALAFQASFTFLNSKFKGLTAAIRGE